MERVLDAFRLSRDRRGRAAYVSWLEARAKSEGGRIEEKAMEAMEAIRCGWYLGEEGFKDKLLGKIDTAGAKIRKRGSVAGAAARAHGEIEAERIIRIVGGGLGLAKSMEELELLREGDPSKVICAARVKGLTSVKNDWLVKRLCMGHPAAMILYDSCDSLGICGSDTIDFWHRLFPKIEAEICEAVEKDEGCDEFVDVSHKG